MANRQCSIPKEELSNSCKTVNNRLGEGGEQFEWILVIVSCNLQLAPKYARGRTSGFAHCWLNWLPISFIKRNFTWREWKWQRCKARPIWSRCLSRLKLNWRRNSKRTHHTEDCSPIQFRITDICT